MSKITQKQMAFYKLYYSRFEYKDRFVPAWEFGGEMLVKPLNEWVLMSYKCPTRLTDLYQENPTLLERELIHGKSGATYYGYRIRAGVTAADIKDEKIREFYEKIKSV